jgi:rod shape-determining protein MreD
MHRDALKPVIFLILLAGFAQSTSFDYIRLFGVKPDILLIISVFSALLFSRNDAVKCAILAGSIKDITSSAILGSYTLSFFLICVFINIHHNKFYREKTITQIVLIFFAYIFMGACVFLLNAVAYRQADFFYSTAGIVFRGALYTCLIAPILFFVISKILRIKLAQVF